MHHNVAIQSAKCAYKIIKMLTHISSNNHYLKLLEERSIPALPQKSTFTLGVFHLPSLMAPFKQGDQF